MQKALDCVQGGIATFSNPLQGAIFGPMALSVLSVLYDLHLTSHLTLDEERGQFGRSKSSDQS